MPHQEDVFVDSAKSALHETGDQQNMGGVPGGCCPSHDRYGEGLASQGWSKGPNDVLVRNLRRAPMGQVSLPYPFTGGGTLPHIPTQKQSGRMLWTEEFHGDVGGYPEIWGDPETPTQTICPLINP
jgi:hypothetical protein